MGKSTIRLLPESSPRDSPDSPEGYFQIKVGLDTKLVTTEHSFAELSVDENEAHKLKSL